MVVVPLATTAAQSAGSGQRASRPDSAREYDAMHETAQEPAHEQAQWLLYAAAGTLALGGALLATGRRRAGLITALSGAVLAMIDQQEAVGAWWGALPGYLDDVQGMLCRANEAVTDLTEQGEKLRQVFRK